MSSSKKTSVVFHQQVTCIQNIYLRCVWRQWIFIMDKYVTTYYSTWKIRNLQLNFQGKVVTVSSAPSLHVTTFSNARKNEILQEQFKQKSKLQPTRINCSEKEEINLLLGRIKKVTTIHLYWISTDMIFFYPKYNLMK